MRKGSDHIWVISFGCRCSALPLRYRSTGSEMHLLLQKRRRLSSNPRVIARSRVVRGHLVPAGGATPSSYPKRNLNSALSTRQLISRRPSCRIIASLLKVATYSAVRPCERIPAVNNVLFHLKMFGKSKKKMKKKGTKNRMC